jgi:hypothetical protein
VRTRHTPERCVRRANRQRRPRRADGQLDEAGAFDGIHPVVHRRAPGDASGPQVDLAHRCLRKRLAVGDVGELKESSRPEHTERLAEHGGLVGTQIDHSVGNDHVGPAALEGHLFE